MVYHSGSEEKEVQIGFVTDQGGSAKENEDSFYVNADAGLFMVADGLGGHNAGKCASMIVIEEVSDYIGKINITDQSAPKILEEAILNANVVVANAAQADPEWRSDMGSTVVVALLRDNQFFISNVGDSRAYLIKDDSIEQLSEDHTFVADWVKAGMITKEQARTHEARRGLWMALGIEGDVQPYCAHGKWNGESRLLLCSDGLTDVVQDEEILEIVKQSESPQAACNSLLTRAKQLHTGDHITVVMVAEKWR